MYKVTGSRVFADKRIQEKAECMRRARNLAAGIGVRESDILWFTDEELPRIIEENEWTRSATGRGASVEKPDPDFIFTAFDFGAGAAGRFERLKSRWPSRTAGPNLKGYTGECMLHHTAHDAEYDKRNNMVCRFSREYSTADGCLHRCLYCGAGGGIGRTITMMLNIEEFIEKAVIPCHEAHAWQKTYRFDTDSTDTLCFEPEYDCLRPLVEFYGTTDKYLIIHTKSVNVGPLLDLNHKGHTIVVWSMAGADQARLVQKNTGAPGEIAAAAARLKAAGYTVRFKFKPIVPVKNWRQEATAMLEKLFAVVKPDNLSMETLFFRNVSELKSMFDQSLFDPEFMAMMEKHEAETGIPDEYKSIPEAFRIEIYEYYAAEVKRLSPETPISLCAEGAAVWDHMVPLLGQSPDDFICNCGPACIPYLKPRSMVNAPDFKPTIAKQ